MPLLVVTGATLTCTFGSAPATFAAVPPTPTSATAAAGHINHNVPVTNVWTITDNYWDEQTSLNNVQAVHTPGEPYTLVVSPVEPCTDAGCVANWVSTGGLNQGTLSIRFQDIDLEHFVAPTVSARVVKLSELDGELPAGTAYVTPEERAEVLATRKAGYDKRYAPYPQI